MSPAIDESKLRTEISKEDSDCIRDLKRARINVCIMREGNVMLWHWAENMDGVIVLVVAAQRVAEGELWMEWDSVIL